jgi:hypothetical protein
VPAMPEKFSVDSSVIIVGCVPRWGS